MLLCDLAQPISVAHARTLALVFSPEVATRLAELCFAHGSPNCVPKPSLLTDGRFMLSADLLTEVHVGGLLAEMWAHADHAIVGSSVEVIAWGEVVEMLPPPEPMPWEA